MKIWKIKFDFRKKIKIKKKNYTSNYTKNLAK